MLVVRIRAVGGCMRGGETKILKRGGKLGQGVGALKRGVLEPPYKLWLNAGFPSCK